MAKDYDANELASRTFVISMVGVAMFIVTVFIWIL
jgi:hypothetical protein